MIELNSLFAYNQWANQNLHVQVATVFTPDIARLFCHLSNAHHIWNSRIKYNVPSVEVLSLMDHDALGKVLNENHLQSLEILNRTKGLDLIAYRNTAGQEFRSSEDEILFHILNHSTHHRPQIMSLSRKEGVLPTSLDYIFYTRALLRI